MKTYFYLSIFLLAITVGCSKAKKKTASPPPTQKTSETTNNVQAPAKAIDNYAVNESKQILVKKAALEKEHLLRAQLVDFSQPVALFNGLKSRIVSFRLQDEKLYMLEATKGHKVSNDIPIDLILTSFPVTAQDEDTVTIDFNEGMKKVFASSGWNYSETSGTVETQHVDVDQSFIKDAKITASNLLYIQQTAALRDSEQGSAVLAHIEARYYLTPYNPDSDYVPMETVKDDEEMYRYGFFSVTETFNGEKEEKRYAARFNPNKPITFAVSPNTPAEYVQAVKDAILYWNGAFGKEVVKAIMAPEGVSAPNPEYNVIQWLDWPGAGFARADAQMDPRTGQTLNGQVMMTSVFAISGKKAAMRYIEQEELSPSGKTVLEQVKPELLERLGADIHQLEEKKSLKLKSFGKFELETPLCNHPLNEVLANAKEAVKEAMSQGKEELALKISQDYVRETVAHEVGHVLGLRHNFAGSLAASYTLKNRDKMVAEYLKTGKAPEGVVTSSSVMEYQRFGEAAISGDQIAQGHGPHKYDFHAIQKLYMGIEFPADENGEFLFCTDGHVGEFADCQRFDLGHSPFEFSQYETASVFNNLKFSLIRKYIDAKVNGKPLDSVVHVPVKTAIANWENLLPAMQSLTLSGKLIRFYRRHSASEISMREPLIKRMQFEWLSDQVNELGGLSAVFDVVGEGFAEPQMAQTQELFSQHFSKGISNDGKPYEFSADEVQYMLKEMNLLYLNLQVYFPLIKSILLAKEDSLRDDGGKSTLAAAFKDYVAKTADDLIFRLEKGEETPEGYKDFGKQELYMKNGHKSEVESMKLPIYGMIYPIREAAANMLRRGRGASDAWGMSERGALYRKLQEYQTQAFGQVQLQYIDKSRLANTELQEWTLEHDALSKILSVEEPEQYQANNNSVSQP